MTNYTCFIHNYSQEKWSFEESQPILSKKHGINIEGKSIPFGYTEQDKSNALLCAQANKLVEYTQAFYNKLEEGILKDQIRKTLEEIKCFNYQN